MSSTPNHFAQSPDSPHRPSLQADGPTLGFTASGSINLTERNSPALEAVTSLSPSPLEQISNLIAENFLSGPNSQRIAAIKSLHDQGIGIETDPSRKHIVDLKFMFSHWHSKRCVESIACLHRPSATKAERSAAVDCLEVLKPFLSDDEISDQIVESMRDHPDAYLKLQQLVFESRLPASMLKLRAYEPHRKFSCLPEHWPGDAKNFRYTRTQDGFVEYRGIRFRSGDFMVADLAIPHDGLLESFATEIPIYTHAGLFVDYEPTDGGPRIPAVIEIHKKGKRIVPLAAWLSPNFVYLARALRLPQVQDDISRLLSNAYRNMPEISYDWQARDPLPNGVLTEGRTCATCTTLGAILLAQIGITYPMPRAIFTAKAVENLSMLGLRSVRDFYSTSNLGLASGLHNIGSIDNRMFEANFARYMYIGYPSILASVGDNMANKTLVPNRLPTSYRTTVIEIALAQRKDFIGKTLQHVAGFKPNQMPDSAPAEVIAFYLVSNHVFSDGIKQFVGCESVQEIASRRCPVVLSEHIQSPSIVHDRQRIQNAIGASRWYD